MGASRFGVLGPLEVRDLAGRSVPLGGQKPRELLAVLLLNHGQTLSVDRLVRHLWGESPSDGAAITLRTHVGRVRKVIEDAGSSARLVNHLGGYRLELGPDTLDADVFESLVRDGHAAASEHRHAEAGPVLEQALSLWRGEVLEDLGSPDFATTAATRLNELQLVAWEHEMESRLATGRHSEAISKLRQLVEEHPFRERFWGQLMVALYRAGRQTEALAAYGSARHRLAEELGLDPGPELRALESSMLRQDPSLQSASLPLVALVDGVRTVPPADSTPNAGIAPASGSRRELDGEALLERGPVLERLLTAYDSASENGRFVWLTGEAGLGKTSVLRVLAEEVEASVWRGQCDPLTTPRPLGPLMDLAAGPLEELHDVLAGKAQSFTAFGVMLAAIRRQPVPPVVILEDIHWADDATLDLLRFLTRRLQGTPGLVIATLRDHEVSARPELVRLVGDSMREPGVERVTLSPLSLDAVTVLSRGTGIDAGRLFEVSGGNPFFVTEVVAAGSLSATNVVGAVHARAALLGDESRAVLDIVSLDPRSLEIQHLRRLADVADEAIDSVLVSGLLVEREQRLSFRHELARRAIADSLGPVRRRRLHARLLDWLSTSGGSEPSRLAHHAIGTEESGPILEQVPRALDEAMARGARREAVRFADAMLKHACDMAPETEFELQLLHARNLGHVNEPPRALSHAERARQIGRDLDDPRREGLAWTVVARSQWLAGEVDVARQSCDRAIALLRPSGDCAELVEALVMQATYLMLMHRHRECLALAEEAADISRRLGDKVLERPALAAIGASEIVSGDAERGIALLEELVGDAEAVGDMDLAVTLLVLRLGASAGEVRRYPQAESSLSAGVDRARAVDSDYMATFGEAWRARIAFEQGRWDDALEIAGGLDLRMDDGIKIPPVTAATVQARIMVRRGDPDARARLEGLLEPSQTLDFQHTWSLRCGIAEELWLRGDASVAGHVLAGSLEQAQNADTAWGRGEVGYWLWRTGHLATMIEGAAEPFAAMTDGRWARAAQLWQELGCPYERALALAEGDVAAQAEALSTFDQLGARPAATWLRMRLDSGDAERGLGPGSGSRRLPDGLTTRQSEILELVLEGLTNAQIADRLFVSAKTVEHHVSSVLTKLGIETRRELAATRGRIGGRGPAD